MRRRLKRIKVELLGKEREAIVVDKTHKRITKRKIDGKIYLYAERVFLFYVPKDLRDKAFLVVPIDREELEMLERGG